MKRGYFWQRKSLSQDIWDGLGKIEHPLDYTAACGGQHKQGIRRRKKAISLTETMKND